MAPAKRHSVHINLEAGGGAGTSAVGRTAAMVAPARAWCGSGVTERGSRRGRHPSLRAPDRSVRVALVLDRLGLAEPAPLLLVTIRGWVSFVETALLTWLQNPDPEQERLEPWLVDQLLAVARATAEHDPRSAEQLTGLV